MTIPLHLLTNRQTKMWLHFSTVRRIMAGELTRRYPAGCGVLAWRGLKHIANVAPNGKVFELSPPFRRYERHQIANKPEIEACPCANFFHPEYHEWRNHPDHARGLHHPFCQFDQTSGEVYGAVFKEATGGVTEIDPTEHFKAKELRPDAYDRARERAQGKRGEKSGARSG